MPSPSAPFRADHVGSLLRPTVLKAARQQNTQLRVTPRDGSDYKGRQVAKTGKTQEKVVTKKHEN